ncbi:MAG: hypothetical protein KF902_05275 [Phycisphaeraceae bacterium]|nr:hypothetical protein [Phycisphaeraceae bacterium]
MIASPDLTHEAAHNTTPAAPTDRQRWAHLLVLDMLKANLPLDRLAAHLNIPFLTLIDYINTPEVQAEIDAYDQLLTLRARLLGQTARPVSLRKLLDILESPAPQPSGRDPEADQRTLHRHAELIRRTATTIARESRALAPKPIPNPKPVPDNTADQRAQRGAPSATQQASSGALSGSQSKDNASSRVACLGEDQACKNSVTTHGREDDAIPSEEPTHQSQHEPPAPASPAPSAPTLRAAAGSTRTLRDTPRRARDRPAA